MQRPKILVRRVILANGETVAEAKSVTIAAGDGSCSIKQTVDVHASIDQSAGSCSSSSSSASISQSFHQ